jgi:RimJ/RimL family protein N-acetyltransferase
MINQQSAAPRTMTLQDSRVVTIRPLEESDREALLAFGKTLPEDDWLYLELDFRNPNIIAWLTKAHAATNWRQLVVVADGTIVAYSNVRLLPGWKHHVGDIHLVVSEDWRRNGLGTALAQAIRDAARDLGIAKVIVEMVEEQTAGRAIFERLGFAVEGVLRDHAQDRSGQRHNMLILGYLLS